MRYRNTQKPVADIAKEAWRGCGHRRNCPSFGEQRAAVRYSSSRHPPTGTLGRGVSKRTFTNGLRCKERVARAITAAVQVKFDATTAVRLTSAHHNRYRSPRRHTCAACIFSAKANLSPRRKPSATSSRPSPETPATRLSMPRFLMRLLADPHARCTARCIAQCESPARGPGR